MQNFESNSNASKKLQEDAEKKILAERKDARPKKENSLAKKFFVQDLKTTASSVVNEIIIPGTKNLISTIVKRAIDGVLFGGSAFIGPNGNTNYSSFARNVTYAPGFNPIQNGFGVPQGNQNSISSLEVGQWPFSTQAEAVEHLYRMREIINKYNMVSVQDFWDIAKKPNLSNYTDNKYGWKDLSSAQVVFRGNAYYIHFPKIIVLD